MSRYLLPLMTGLMLASPLALAEGPKRGGEITVVYKDDFDSMDPAIGYTVQSWSPIKAVFDGLMDYKPGTTELEPDLAQRDVALLLRVDDDLLQRILLTSI